MHPLYSRTADPSDPSPRPFLVIALLAGLAAPGALAASPSPRTGDMAIAFGLGVGSPAESTDAFRSGGAVSLSMEMYWTAAKSARGTLGSLNLPAREGSGRGDRSAIYLAGNVSYNWLRKVVFPYVTAGLGIYLVEERLPTAGDDDTIEAGVNAGAGVEFRLHRRVTLRLEGLVHALTGEPPQAIATGTLGVKLYF